MFNIKANFSCLSVVDEYCKEVSNQLVSMGGKPRKVLHFFIFLWPFVQIGLNFHKFWKSWKNTNIWKNQKVSCLSNFLLDLSLRILSDGRKVQSWSKFNSMLCLSFVPSISKILLSLSTLCYYALVLCYKSKDKITNCKYYHLVNFSLI